MGTRLPFSTSTYSEALTCILSMKHIRSTYCPASCEQPSLKPKLSMLLSSFGERDKTQNEKHRFEATMITKPSIKVLSNYLLSGVSVLERFHCKQPCETYAHNHVIKDWPTSALVHHSITVFPQFKALCEIRGDTEMFCGLVEDVLWYRDCGRGRGVL